MYFQIPGFMNFPDKYYFHGFTKKLVVYLPTYTAIAWTEFSVPFSVLSINTEKNQNSQGTRPLIFNFTEIIMGLMKCNVFLISCP